MSTYIAGLFQLFINVIGRSCAGGDIVKSILQMRKPRHRKVKWLSQGHTGSKWQRQSLNPGSPATELGSSWCQAACQKAGVGHSADVRQLLRAEHVTLMVRFRLALLFYTAPEASVRPDASFCTFYTVSLRPPCEWEGRRVIASSSDE